VSDETLLSRFRRLKPEQRKLLQGSLTLEQAKAFDADWTSWAHIGQRPPAGNWRTWVIMAGRGFGKTRAGAEWIAEAVRTQGKIEIALIAATLEEARRLMVEGTSGLLNVAPDLIGNWTPSIRKLRFKSGAEATLFSGASPEMLRGPEHHLIWCDELAKWEKPDECWDMMQLGLRLGVQPRTLVTTTPRPGSLLRRIMNSRGCVVTGGATQRNPHLPAAYIEAVEDMFVGTRLGRQELDGVLIPDVAGALWSIDLIERRRILNRDCPYLEFTRTVIGVDPPASASGTCGISACAMTGTRGSRDATAFVLADHSISGTSPEGWANAVAEAFDLHQADAIVAERNQGGNMVESVLRAANSSLPIKLVNASAGKSARAEPVAMLFEAGKAWLCGKFPELEAELCGLLVGGGYEPMWSGGSGGPGNSPDRADACVWALTELMIGKKAANPSVRRL
jgi:phage terminase large subunit-like protein